MSQIEGYGSSWNCWKTVCCCRISFVVITLLLVTTVEIEAAAPKGKEGKRGQEKDTCQPSDFHYAYTECDESGVRWRVSVPEPDTCIGGAPEAPKRAVDCNFSCGPGEFLDAESQKCEKCPKGQFSLGGGKVYQDWSTLPAGFNIDAKEELYFDEDPSCNNSQWALHGNHIRSPGDQCIAIFTYAANLMKSGYIEFIYSLATDDTVFHVSVSNERCETIGRNTNRWPSATGEGKWKSYKLELESGMNIIRWKAVGIAFSHSEESANKPNPILIKEVKIMGLRFTSECTETKPGTFVDEEGTSTYKDCAVNTYSADPGAVECTPCDAATKYSFPGAQECQDKKPCTESDYYLTHTPCDEHNQTQEQYMWIERRICRSDISGSVQLPASGKVSTCPPCNPGMSAFNSTSCIFCTDNMFSDGTSPCKECPSNTAPVHEINYIRWRTLPSNMDVSCLSLTEYGCTDEDGWQLEGDHIHSGKGHADDVYLVLDLAVHGMISEEGYFDGKAEELGVISFWFSLECSSNCILFFIRDDADGSPVIEQWTGSQEKQEYRYSITKQSPVTFSWAFQKTDISSDYSHIPTYNFRNDVAKIYSTKVTNTVDGGAARCTECPRGSNIKGCIPCEPGHYIANETNECVKCPKNTYLRATNPYGPESCVPCGPGLQSDGGTECFTVCHVHIQEDSHTRHYELRDLKGIHSVQTGASFTARGSRFFHYFNISLCGTVKGKGTAQCFENVTDITEDGIDEETLSAYVCRSTIIPSSGETAGLSAQPISLGDRLIGINNENSLDNLNETIFLSDSEVLKDLRFYYHSAWPTLACPEGRSTILTLRCDLTAKGNGTFVLPIDCPSGTCDGCAFHLLWRTEHACPRCEEEDYKTYKEECNHGKQNITYMWKEPKSCQGGINLPSTLLKECVIPPWYNQVPWYAQVSIAAFMGCVVLLISCAIFFWKKNRKLEYKYQKLVASANGELPAAETCAVEDGDDEDDVTFEDGGGGQKSHRLFSKFRSRPKSNKEYLIGAEDMAIDSFGLSPKIALTTI